MTPHECVLYLHVAKAGGTTLSTWLYDHLRAEDESVEEDGWLFSGVYYYPSGYIQGPKPDELERIPAVLARPDLRAVLGHFSFGIHEQLCRRGVYVTMLREPVSRIVSLYNFQRAVQEREGKLEGVEIPASMTLEDFVREPPYPEADNGQCRRISGQTPPVGGCTREMLETAKRRLCRQFRACGLTERFDESLVLFRRRLGWSRRSLYYYPRNVTPAGTPAQALPARTVTLIRERNALDVELYGFATRAFEEAIAAEGHGFGDEVARFRASREEWLARTCDSDLPAGFR